MKLSEKLTEISDNTFEYCSGIRRIEIPESVTDINQNAFKSCENLNIITIPNTVTDIANTAFAECSGLSAIRYTGSKAEWDKYGLTEDDINHATVYYNYDPNHDHSYEETIIHPASCTETGLKKMICSLCGEFYEEEIPLQEHNVVIDEGVAATCETAGKTEGSHCSVCGTVLKAQEEIPATGHTIVEDAYVAPTCETPGKTEGSHCSECGFVFQTQQEIPPTGHSWTEKEITKEATCTEDGERTLICMNCGNTMTESISALGHEKVKDEAIDPTCETPGKTEGSHCSRCDFVFQAQEEIPARGHAR